MQTAANLVFLVTWSEVKQKLQIRQWMLHQRAVQQHFKKKDSTIDYFM